MSLEFLRLGCEACGVRGVKLVVQGVRSPTLIPSFLFSFFQKLNIHFY